MLVLIAGITGTCGQHLARAAMAADHRVRGLTHDSDDLEPDIEARLEGFVKMADAFDIQALAEACKDVDAVMCAYSWEPQLIVEGQVLLLRAAEKAGVKIFHACSWNYDQLGDHEAYDSYIMFCNHARTSSTIRPIYGFTGLTPQYTLTHPSVGVSEHENLALNYFGDGDERDITAADLAAYSIAAISDPDAASGGLYHVIAFHEPDADTYEEVVRGVKINWKHHGGGNSTSHDERQHSNSEHSGHFLHKTRSSPLPPPQSKHLMVSDSTADSDSSHSKIKGRPGLHSHKSFREWLHVHIKV
ncbi:NmrA-like family protein [Apiospora saccharicola]